MAPTRLSAGARLGSHEVRGLIGEGGMGAVYRARDTRLGREVAIKVLLPAVAQDAERLARFQREAQVLAALNHPHIAHLYGLEDGPSGPFLVMELVEGPTLADQISHGPIPLGEAIPIVRQIAEALEIAHEQGIVHRDLKPANIKVRDDGSVKVLDFGLATGPDTSRAQGEVDAAHSPTITSPAAVTGVGMLLGTAAYMSPEQARGHKADKRSDIWALGCVFYEMLTGKRAFDGEDMVEVLGAVVRLEPDWAAVPSNVPPAMVALLRGCLVKQPRERVADISTVLFVLGHAATLAGPSSTIALDATVGSKRWRQAVAVGAALVVGAAASALYFHLLNPATAPTEERRTVQLSLVLPDDVSLAPGVNQIVPVVSPDGRRLAFSASRPGEPIRLWIRSLHSPDARSLPGTDNARGPFWSPDGQRLAFFTDDKLKVVDVAGGPVQTVSDVSNPAGGAGASWSRAGTIVFARRVGGLMKVPAAGGDPSPATVVDPASGDGSHLFPSFLPDGRRFLYLSKPSNTVWLGTLDSSEAARLFSTSTSSQVLYADGHLLFARQGTLLARPFDARLGTLRGDPFAVAEPVATDTTIGAAAFSISDTGVLVYRTGATSAVTQLTWVDRAGREIGKVGSEGSYRNPELSGDGSRVAVEETDADNGTQDLYILELARGTPSRFTVDRGNDIYPVWSPDDSRIAFGSDRQGGVYNLYEKLSSGGAGEQLLHATAGDPLTGPAPWDWSSDGKFLLFRNTSLETQGNANVSVLSLSGERTPQLLFPPAAFNQTQAQVSPNGRWVAYYSRETSRNEVYIASFPTPLGRWPISNGGSHPRWRGDGRELFYQAADGRIMAVPVSGTTTLDPGTPIPLFPARILGGPVPVTGFRAQYAVAADGQRFLLNVPVDQNASMPAITVVLNWATGKE